MRIAPLLRAACIALAFAFVATPLFALDQRVRAAVERELGVKEFTVQSLDVSPDRTASVVIRLNVGGSDAALELRPRSMRADAFQLLVADDRGLTNVTPPPERTYRGDAYVAAPNATVLGAVRASIDGGRMWAWIRLDDGTSYGVQPLSEIVAGADPRSHVVYRGSDVHLEQAYSCATDAIGDLPFDAATKGPSQWSATGLKVCEVAIDADVQFFQSNGSSVTNTVFDIENVMNSVEAIYENDVGVTYDLTSIVVRTSSAANPYTTDDPSSLLSEFRSHWQQTKGDVQRNNAHLFTGRNLTGSVIGIAYLNGICNGNAYGLSQSKFTGNFALRVGLTAHELGHNWSANHCSGSDCRIMCPSINGCVGDVSKFGQASKNAIVAYKATKSLCLKDLPDSIALPFFDTFATAAISPSLWSHVKDVATNTHGVNPPSAPLVARLHAVGPSEFGDDEMRTSYLLAGSATDLVLSYFVEHRGVEAGEKLFVEYRSNNLTWVQLNELTSSGVDQDQFTFHAHALPANAFHDELRIRFRVDVDQLDDHWYIDDVRVDDCPAPFTYGTSEIGSTGNAATIAFTGGMPYAGNSAFGVTLTGGTPSQFAVLFSGGSQAAVTVTWGTILVGPPNFLRTYLSTDTSGGAFLGIPVAPAMVGTTSFYQYVVRDPGFGGDVQASNGLSVTFCP